MDSILCLDLGTKMGWAQRAKCGRITSGNRDFTPKRSKPSPHRYLFFRDWLRSVHVDRFDLVYFELVAAHKGTIAAQTYGGFASILFVERWPGTHLSGVPVGTIKKTATGKGNASKTDVKASVNKLFRAVVADVTSNDEADALALLHWAITQELLNTK
jgi:hypothetical protein